MRLRKHKHYGNMSITLQMLMLTFEAESVAFSVCAYYGIETGENSFGYLASWSSGQDLKELKASLETINRTAGGLINDIDKNFDLICKERGIDRGEKRVEPRAHSSLMEIIWSEAQGFFAGDKTAEDTAKNIQSRVSIYMAEQG